MVKAALRDASWFSRPNVTSIKRYHVIHSTEGTPLCGLQAVLCTEDSVDGKDVPQALRCQRPGCRQAWPKETP